MRTFLFSKSGDFYLLLTALLLFAVVAPSTASADESGIETTAKMSSIEAARIQLEEEIQAYNELVESMNEVVVAGSKNGQIAFGSGAATWGSSKLFLWANNYTVKHGQVGNRLRARGGHAAWIVAALAMIASAGSTVVHGSKLIYNSAEFMGLAVLLSNQGEVLDAQTRTMDSINPDFDSSAVTIEQLSEDLDSMVEKYKLESGLE